MVTLTALLLLLAVAAGPTCARDYVDADDHKRQDVTMEFFRMYRAHRFVAPWEDQGAGGDFVVYLDKAADFKGPDFVSVQPNSRDRGEFFIASVCAHGNPRKPTYLYLLSWKRRTLHVIRAYHLVDGRTQKIAD